MKQDVISAIAEKKIMAIVRGFYFEDALGLARALEKGGVSLMEITFDQFDAAEQQKTADTLRLLNKELGDKMCFGAGTVTSVAMAKMAYEAGARFIVSPDTNPDVIEATVAMDMVSVPGALTPTEIKHAYDLGADFVKVFPACNMGVSYFKNIHAPLPQVKLLAVGGVTADDAGDYLAAGCSGIGVAGCLFKKDWVKNGEWDKITAASRTLCEKLGV